MKNFVQIIPFGLLNLILAGLLIQLPPAFAASTEKITVATFEAFNYGYKGPDSIPAGWTTVRIVNKGKDSHHIQLIKLAPGKTEKDFRVALKESEIGLPSWAENAGGPNGVAPGGEASATVPLEPGAYVLICVIPNQFGIPHVALNMIKSLTVTANVAPPAVEPKADLTLTESDFAFALSKPISSGKQIIKVVNRGTQPHEVVAVRLTPGASIKDFANALSPDVSDPPPGTLVGGITGLEKGKRGFFVINFTPGRYGFICFFPDAKGAPHFAQGMITEFTVK